MASRAPAPATPAQIERCDLPPLKPGLSVIAAAARLRGLWLWRGAFHAFGRVAALSGWRLRRHQQEL